MTNITATSSDGQHVGLFSGVLFLNPLICVVASAASGALSNALSAGGKQAGDLIAKPVPTDILTRNPSRKDHS